MFFGKNLSPLGRNTSHPTDQGLPGTEPSNRSSPENIINQDTGTVDGTNLLNESVSSSSSEESFASSHETTNTLDDDNVEGNEQTNERTNEHGSERTNEDGSQNRELNQEFPPQESGENVNQDDTPKIICKYFSAGFCRLTKRLCEYDHPKLCRYFLRNPLTGCKKDRCSRLHPTLCKTVEESGYCNKICFKFHRHRASGVRRYAPNRGYRNSDNYSNRNYSRMRMNRLERENEGNRNQNYFHNPAQNNRRLNAPLASAQRNVHRNGPTNGNSTTAQRNAPPPTQAINQESSRTAHEANQPLPASQPNPPRSDCPPAVTTDVGAMPNIPSHQLHPPPHTLTASTAIGSAPSIASSPSSDHFSSAPSTASSSASDHISAHPILNTPLHPPRTDNLLLVGDDAPNLPMHISYTLPLHPSPLQPQALTHFPPQPLPIGAQPSPPPSLTQHIFPVPFPPTGAPQAGLPSPQTTNHTLTDQLISPAESIPLNLHPTSGVPPPNPFLYEMLRRQAWLGAEPLFHHTAHRVMTQMQVPPMFPGLQV